MAQSSGSARLTDSRARAAAPRERPYRLADGGSLFLLIRPSGFKTWEFRYKTAGKVRAKLLGEFPEVGLAKARQERDRLRVELRGAPGKAPTITFAAAADAWVAANRRGWSEAHAHQTEQSLADHVLPILGESVALAAVSTADVLRVLEPLLDAGLVETARRVRWRLSCIFEDAQARYGLAVNPVLGAREVLRKRFRLARKAAPKGHFPCIAQAETPQLMRALAAYAGSVVTRSLTWFVAYTACRTGEARFATWEEFDLGAALWRVPGERMKAGRPIDVPLAPQTVALLRALKPYARGELVFPHPTKAGKPASENAVLFVLKAVGFDGRMTGHGFRSLFSTWANERGFRHDVIEAALAHADPNATRAAYNMAQYLDDRRALACAWADHLDAEARSRPKLKRAA